MNDNDIVSDTHEDRLGAVRAYWLDKGSVEIEVDYNTERAEHDIAWLLDALTQARGDAQAAESRYEDLAESIPDGPADDAQAAMAGVPPFTWRQRAEQAYEVVRKQAMQISELESELADEDENASDAQSYRQTGY